MSYDLNFWKPTQELTAPPQEVYERLCKGEFVPGLETLPIEAIAARIREVFSTVESFYFEQICQRLDWEGREGEGAFQVGGSPQHVRVDCYGLRFEHMNQLIDIAYEFACSFYDPQVGQFYSSPSHETSLGIDQP